MNPIFSGGLRAVLRRRRDERRGSTPRGRLPMRVLLAGELRHLTSRFASLLRSWFTPRRRDR